MSKFLIRILCMCAGIVFLFTIAAALAPAPPRIINIEVDGKPIYCKNPPMIVGGRSIVPIREIFESLGMSISWDDSAKEVTANKGSTTIKLAVDSTSATVNGEDIPLDMPVLLKNNQVMVPIRFLAENIGAEVRWDQGADTIKIFNVPVIQGEGYVGDSDFSCRVIPTLDPSYYDCFSKSPNSILTPVSWAAPGQTLYLPVEFKNYSTNFNHQVNLTYNIKIISADGKIIADKQNLSGHTGSIYDGPAYSMQVNKLYFDSSMPLGTYSVLTTAADNFGLTIASNNVDIELRDYIPVGRFNNIEQVDSFMECYYCSPDIGLLEDAFNFYSEVIDCSTKQSFVNEFFINAISPYQAESMLNKSSPDHVNYQWISWILNYIKNRSSLDSVTTAGLPENLARFCASGEYTPFKDVVSEYLSLTNDEKSGLFGDISSINNILYFYSTQQRFADYCSYFIQTDPTISQQHKTELATLVSGL